MRSFRDRRNIVLLSGESVISTPARVQRILSFLLLWLLPVTALADGMVVPTIAYPAKITIPDQRALICFSNGMERLVIETRFTGAGTNFAWVVPLPSQPVIEEATTGLFPTLQYLFRTEITHEVPHYYVGILVLLAIIYALRLTVKSIWSAFVAAIFFMLLAAFFLPALGAKRRGMEPTSSAQAVSVLDRKIVGIFEITTIASRDAKALQTWLLENGYAVPTNSEPVIASYAKDGWVFVAAKVRRDSAAADTSTPHPLSFTFKTDKPVYPMRLTGLNGQSLSIELYVFGPARAQAAHFVVERCTQPNYPSIPDTAENWIYRRHHSPDAPDIFHPLLRQWTAGLPVATKLTATLTPADMRNDVWLNQPPFYFEQKTRLFSRQGALTTALNWGTGLFAAGLFMVCFLAFSSQTHKTRLPRRIGVVALVSIVLVGLVYLSLPKIEVKLVKTIPTIDMNIEQLGLEIILEDGGWRTLAEARAVLQEAISNPTNPVVDRIGWTNYLVGGQIREEDSPGNYLLRETNNQLEFVGFYPDGAEEIYHTWDLQAQH